MGTIGWLDVQYMYTCNTIDRNITKAKNITSYISWPVLSFIEKKIKPIKFDLIDQLLNTEQRGKKSKPW